MSNLQKKIIAVLVFALFGWKTFAQVTKGSIIVPANFSFNHMTTERYVKYVNGIEGNQKYNELNITSKIGLGYSIFRNVILGVKLNNDLNKRIFFNPNGENTKEVSQLILPGIFGRYYVINKKYGVFVEANYFAGKPKTLLLWDSDRVSSTSATQKIIGLGFNYFLNEKVCFEVITSFSKNNYLVNLKDLGDGDQTKFKVSKQNEKEIKLNVGITYYFNKNRS